MVTHLAVAKMTIAPYPGKTKSIMGNIVPVYGFQAQYVSQHLTHMANVVQSKTDICSTTSRAQFTVFHTHLNSYGISSSVGATNESSQS